MLHTCAGTTGPPTLTAVAVQMGNKKIARHALAEMPLIETRARRQEHMHRSRAPVGRALNDARGESHDQDRKTKLRTRCTTGIAKACRKQLSKRRWTSLCCASCTRIPRLIPKAGNTPPHPNTVCAPRTREAKRVLGYEWEHPK